jgi:hypothetical protein
MNTINEIYIKQHMQVSTKHVVYLTGGKQGHNRRSNRIVKNKVKKDKLKSKTSYCY